METTEIRVGSGAQFLYDTGGSAATVVSTAQAADELVEAAKTTSDGRLLLRRVPLEEVVRTLEERRRAVDVAGSHRVGTAHYSSTSMSDEIIALRARVRELTQGRRVCPECRHSDFTEER